MTLRMI